MTRHCRFCNQELTVSFADLGETPLANSYLKQEQLSQAEPRYPLHAYVCTNCWLVQLEEFATSDAIFSDYAYFSSYSDSWLQHAQNYCTMITNRLELNANSFVVELASNDGYLLKNFVASGIPCLGIEPAVNVAEYAEQQGVPTLATFFGEAKAHELGSEYPKADLIAANNVLAHVPDLNDFIAGIKVLLNAQGVATIEFPHLLNLIQLNQFDTIYHEHFSYFSLLCLRQVFEHHGLRIFDVEQLPTHGGSLRIYVSHQDALHQESLNVAVVIEQEIVAKLDKVDTYKAYQTKVDQVRVQLLEFIASAKAEGKTVAAYGAPAKGNTLLNFCNLTSSDINFTVDRSPHKQDHYLPGTHIPIYDVSKLYQEQPDYILLLPWNLADEIVAQLSELAATGTELVTAIPSFRRLPWKK